MCFCRYLEKMCSSRNFDMSDYSINLLFNACAIHSITTVTFYVQY